MLKYPRTDHSVWLHMLHVFLQPISHQTATCDAQLWLVLIAPMLDNYSFAHSVHTLEPKKIAQRCPSSSKKLEDSFRAGQMRISISMSMALSIWTRLSISSHHMVKHVGCDLVSRTIVS